MEVIQANILSLISVRKTLIPHKENMFFIGIIYFKPIQIALSHD